MSASSRRRGAAIERELFGQVLGEDARLELPQGRGEALEIRAVASRGDVGVCGAPGEALQPGRERADHAIFIEPRGTALQGTVAPSPPFQGGNNARWSSSGCGFMTTRL
jgi:hypothetical protein